jgi:hypothetical protein
MTMRTMQLILGAWIGLHAPSRVVPISPAGQEPMRVGAGEEATRVGVAGESTLVGVDGPALDRMIVEATQADETDRAHAQVDVAPVASWPALPLSAEARRAQSRGELRSTYPGTGGSSSATLALRARLGGPGKPALSLKVDDLLLGGISVRRRAPEPSVGAATAGAR